MKSVMSSAVLKSFCGLRLAAHRRGSKIEIAYGSVGIDGQKITPAQAETMLQADLLAAERYVSGRLTIITPTQGQFDALVCAARRAAPFVQTVIDRLNSGDPNAALAAWEGKGRLVLAERLLFVSKS